MEDPNLIACLFPEDPYTMNAILNGPSRELRILRQAEIVLPKYSRGSRESTASASATEEEDKHAGLKSHLRLQLDFDPGPKANLGFTIGTDANLCDIVLEKQSRVSRKHCYLTFDSQRRLILVDYSSHGTTIKYNGKGGEERTHFTWILSDLPQKIEKITIEIGKIKLRIVPSMHEAHPLLYEQKVDRFLREVTVDDDLAGHFQPGQTPILITASKLGEGSFGVVRRMWNASTGFEFAAKCFREKMTAEMRSKEVSIMRQVSDLKNEHIVQFLGYLESQGQMNLEYLSFGSLDGQQDITRDESLTILRQSLNALTSVHEAGIAHRDIKPENILVQSRHPLHIKLSDFGLAKAIANLTSRCGSDPYFAPEIITKRRFESYTAACDIWSLGIVVLEYAYDLPQTPGPFDLEWCKEIAEYAREKSSEPLAKFLSTAMLVIRADERLEARECWNKAMLLPSHYQGCSQPMQRVSSAASDDRVDFFCMSHKTPSEVADAFSMDSFGAWSSQVRQTNAASSRAKAGHYSFANTDEQMPDYGSVGNINRWQASSQWTADYSSGGDYTAEQASLGPAADYYPMEDDTEEQEFEDEGSVRESSKNCSEAWQERSQAFTSREKQNESWMNIHRREKTGRDRRNVTEGHSVLKGSRY
ncbi:hypothetical protein VTL71DRAFT_3869 [Oculimacula yallundae]|uniref:non-specific serine/threonine protein kinase n=1 Tax=Oculimacula yallundae TaxID=86028 RepID=A0ABR4C5F6_9HELO